ncbi:hypothetical protein M422DRAFT_149384 [Sphaerobolus stellatus SS14]|nr:hypothetical protein M422DRAFT_149384 [Sphaerobolus stellatus SS14]
MAASVILLFGVVLTPCYASSFQKTTPNIDLPDSITHSWAEYSPDFSIEPYESPLGCAVTQVNILQRHGARFPTSGAGATIMATVAKLQNAQSFNAPGLQFIRNYTYDLGASNLIPFGAAQSFDAGQVIFFRYQELISRDQVPFVRASSSSRVIDSATNWTAGFVKANSGIFIPNAPIVLNEAANDTLDDSMCPNAGSSDAQLTVWQNTFGPAIVARLNALAPGANLSNADIPPLISLCPFDTLAKETVSPWCGLFTEQDFQSFEYFGDLDKYYGTGYGQALGPVQGVGYINELLARLTGKPVSDATQTNRTLDSSPITFPLNRTIYADFTHDDQIAAIFSAMGILRPKVALDPTKPDPTRTWLASHLTPFSSRLVTEKLDCRGRESVRILLNDAVVPLEICGAGGDGICGLEAFVESQAFARNNGDGNFEKCSS